MILSSLFKACNRGPWETHGDDVQYRVETAGNRATVYFQCTSSRKDWLDNFDLWIRPYRGSKWLAHRGFVRKYKSIAENLMARLRDADQVVFVGYSQGAALAVLAHEDYFYRFGKYPLTHAFGCPRVVSWLSKDIWERWAYCFIHNHARDIVGRLPPVCLGFRHVTAPRNFGAKGLPSHKFHYPNIYEEGLDA
ncbi:MAG: hypothetical protein C0436_00120 [Alphaproteobacteria bacterium]|nr:hypothetical protein [Alphaproteobacteria bacterium]